MAVNPLAISIRAKKLGVLLRDARVARGKTMDECARAMGIPKELLEAYELGEQSPSLPEVELLAFYLNLPLEHFWGKVAMSDGESALHKFDPIQLVSLRQRVIGVMVRRARQEAGLTLESLVEKSGIEPELLERYEMGEVPIPVPHLEALTSILDAPIRDFQDQHGPVGQWFNQQRSIHDFLDLAPDLQTFVCKPVNRPYLELAVRLSEMSVDKLRSVAEGLLEITL
jgi:transcriptional regulator with XRE-family HTH domain